MAWYIMNSCHKVVRSIMNTNYAFTMSRTQVKLWYNRFKEVDVRPGRPSTLTTDENIEAVKKMILDIHRISIREVTDDVGISFGSCQTIFTDVLGMKPAAAKF